MQRQPIARQTDEWERKEKDEKEATSTPLFSATKSHLYWLLNDHYRKLIAPLRIEKESHRAFN